ncbi:MAG: glycosyltransferase family 2 protein, partial [Thiolinea sp.]
LLTVIVWVGGDCVGYEKLSASLLSLKKQLCEQWEVCLVVPDGFDVSEIELMCSGQRIYFITDLSELYQQCGGMLLHELTMGDCLHPRLVDELSQCLDLLVDDEEVVVYTDHDHLDSNGERCQPEFKSDWNPDLFIQHDYIGPAFFLLSDWVKQAFDSLPEGKVVDQFVWRGLLAQYAEDAIRSDKKIIHVPKVLYHRRQSEDLGVLSVFSSVKRPVFPLPGVFPKVSLIIPTRDRLDILKPCVDSILQKTTYPDYEIIIVDNQSQDCTTLRWLDEMAGNSRITVLRYDQPFNYAALNNFAVKHVDSQLIGLINNDVEVISPDWLDEMVMHAWRPEIGCVGAKLYYGDGRIQHAGVILGAGGGTAHSHRYFPGDADGYCGRLKLVQNVSAVTGACLLVRRELFELVGGLNEEHLAVAWNDIDLCLKVQEAGYRNLWTPYAELYHHESVSRGRDITPEQRKRYQAEKAWMYQYWGDALWRDPYYNPNLTAAREDFSLNMLYDL